MIMDNYPLGHKAAAVIPLLDLAQRQHGITYTTCHHWLFFLSRLLIIFCGRQLQ